MFGALLCVKARLVLTVEVEASASCEDLVGADDVCHVTICLPALSSIGGIANHTRRHRTHPETNSV
jgi:hypothetical protein